MEATELKPETTAAPAEEQEKGTPQFKAPKKKFSVVKNFQ